MLGDLEGNADAHRSQDLRRRSGHARATVRGARAEGRGDSGRRRRRRSAARQPRGHVASRSRGRRPAGPHGRAGVDAARRCVAGRRRDRAAAATTARSACACAIPTRSASTATRLAQTTIRGANGKLVAGRRRWCTIVPRGSQAELMRENLRQMAIITARLEERDLGSAVAEVQSDARRREAARRLLVSRSAACTSRSARRSASCCSSRAIATALVFLILVDSVPRVHARRADPAGRARCRSAARSRC